MTLGLVTGNVTATQKDPKLREKKLLLVRETELTGKIKGPYQVAVDAVGAGEGDLVVVVTGSSARMTADTNDRPGDAVVIAIVEIVEREGKTLYKKSDIELPLK